MYYFMTDSPPDSNLQTSQKGHLPVDDESMGIFVYAVSPTGGHSVIKTQ